MTYLNTSTWQPRPAVGPLQNRDLKKQAAKHQPQPMPSALHQSQVSYPSKRFFSSVDFTKQIKSHSLNLKHPTILRKNISNALAPQTHQLSLSTKRIERVVKTLEETGGHWAAGSSEENLKQLLLVSNDLVQEMNSLRKQKRHHLHWAFYIHDPGLKAVRDPEFATLDPERNDEIPAFYYYTKPKILGVYPKLTPWAPLKENQPDSDKPENELAVSFSKAEEKHLLQTAKEAGFSGKREHLPAYLMQLFLQGETLAERWKQHSLENDSILPLELGIYSDQKPFFSRIKLNKRGSLAVWDADAWKRLADSRREWRINPVTELFPDGDMQGFHERLDRQSLEWESQFPFWFERKGKNKSQ